MRLVFFLGVHLLKPAPDRMAAIYDETSMGILLS